ncbi:MAG: hypothetical protein HYX61_04195 [Gammaproteobacteria bacterium]|nr:hypothetical protein [Gammaproteobacteria bacterium]
MTDLDDYISLRKFKHNEDEILDLFTAGIAREISLHVHSTESDEFITLSPSQIQQIISKHPEKANVYMGYSFGMSLFSKHRGKVKHKYQLINFSDLWLQKSKIDVFFKKPLQQSLENERNHERSTMLKMILGMAMAAYNFNPEERRNEATGSKKGSIKADIEKMGFDITEDTVRKYLNAAVKKHLPNVVVCED